MPKRNSGERAGKHDDGANNFLELLYSVASRRALKPEKYLVEGREIGRVEIRFVAPGLILEDLLKFIIWLAAVSSVFDKPTSGRCEDEQGDTHLHEFLDFLLTRPI